MRALEARKSASLGTLERSPTLAAGAIVVVLTALYAIVFPPMWSWAGSATMSLVLVPAALAGWLLGPWTGGIASVVLVALNGTLYASVAAAPGLQAAIDPGALAGGLVTLGAGIVFGVLRQRQGALIALRGELQRQLDERQTLTDALTVSEQRFRLLAEESIAGVYLIQNRLFQYVNPAFADAVGYPREDIVGHLGPDDLVHPNDRGTVRRSIADRLEAGAGSARYRFRGVAKDGTVLHLEAMSRAVDLDGKRAILGTLRDRTREAEDEARTKIGLAALEAVPAGIVVTDEDGTVVWVNPHLHVISGYGPDELIGARIDMLADDLTDATVGSSVGDAVQAGETWRGRVTSRRKDGRKYTGELTVSRVGGDVSPTRYVATMVDITEALGAKQHIEELNLALRQRVGRLETLHRIDTVITGGGGLEGGLRPYLEAVRRGLELDAVSLFLLTEDGSRLELRDTLGFRSPTPERLEIPVDAGIVGAAAASRETIVMQGRDAILDSIEPAKKPALVPEEFELLVAVPMVARGELRGVLQLCHRQPLEADSVWLAGVTELAVQGAILIDHALLLEGLRESNQALLDTYDVTIEGWSRTLDLRDKETEGHSRRVTALSLALGRKLGLDDTALLHVRRGALLHDIGKMGVPDAILQKPGALTEEEWAIMRRHTTYARDLLRPIPFMQPALDIPYYHHEKWDGTGYPEGLSGDAIPLAARIFAVADVYDALTSDRPYRPAWTPEQALRHIRQQAGSHFDPAVVDAFLTLMQQPPVQPHDAGADGNERAAGEGRA